MTDKILLVDDDAATIQLLARILAGAGDLRFATGGEDALRLAREVSPDVILLDAEMPGMSGFEVCRSLKADPMLAEAPVIFVTSHAEAAFEVTGFEVGAADFIAKPFNPALVLARVKAQLRVKHMADELRRLSAVDALTGVANRRRFDELLAREWQRASRRSEPLALLMIDVDHFKLFNDHYGHPSGDACLRAVAQALATVTQRPADLVARYGGEEFVVLLPDTPAQGALHIAQRALAAIDALALGHAASPVARHLTVSVGIACDAAEGPHRGALPAGSGTTETRRAARCAGDLVEAADQALYAAKRAGRARAHVVMVGDAGPLPSPASAGTASVAAPASFLPAGSPA